MAHREEIPLPCGARPALLRPSYGVQDLQLSLASVEQMIETSHHFFLILQAADVVF